MPLADRVLYRAFLRTVYHFSHEKIPLTGVVGSRMTCYTLDCAAALRTTFHRPPANLGFAEGAKLLSSLQAQLTTLCDAEERTREALSEWAALMAEFRRRSPDMMFAAAAAAEDGLLLLGRQARELLDPLRIDLDGEDESEQELAAASGRQPLSIDQLVEDVRAAAPDIFSESHLDAASSSSCGGSSHDGGSSCDGGSSSRGSSSISSVGVSQRILEHEAQRRRLEALADVLYRQHRLRYEPFEWVYDGIRPILLPEVLKRRKGAPLALAALAAAVGRRLGLPLLPLPGESAQQAAASNQLAAGAGQVLLSPELASHVASRTPATAPPPSSWVLLLDDRISADHHRGSAPKERAQSSIGHVPPSQGSGHGSQSGGALYLDASNGMVMDEAAVRKKYYTAQLGLDWRTRAALTYWQEAVRTMVQAHQRRGESDLVAHWIYVLLALDPQAGEWDFMLQR